MATSEPKRNLSPSRLQRQAPNTKSQITNQSEVSITNAQYPDRFAGAVGNIRIFRNSDLFTI
jgi:hypothetical protein